MALNGNLRDFAATEILQLLASQKKSGCLQLQSDRGRTCFYVWEGRLVSGRAPGLPEHDPLLDLLERAGRLSTEQVHGIRTIHQESKRDLEDLLVNGRYLESEELATFLERQILDALMQCVQWTSGSYEFDPSERWPNAPIARLSVEAAVIEAARRVDEQKRHRKMFADPQQILAVCDLPDPDDPVSDDELEMFEIIDGHRSVAQIVAAAPLLEYEAYEALHRMAEAHWVEGVGRAELPAETGPKPILMPLERTRPRPTGPGVLVKECVMALIVVGAALCGWYVSTTLQPERDGTGEDLFTRAKIHEVRFALDLYRYERGHYPAQLDALVAGWWIPEDRLEVGERRMKYKADAGGQGYSLGLE